MASIQVDLSDSVLEALRADLLQLLQSSRAVGVILELSGVRIMDREEFTGLRKTIDMAEIMGATPVVCGLQPGVVAGLVELGADIDGINAAGDLDRAFELIGVYRSGEDEREQHDQTLGSATDTDERLE